MQDTALSTKSSSSHYQFYKRYQRIYSTHMDAAYITHISTHIFNKNPSNLEWKSHHSMRLSKRWVSSDFSWPLQSSFPSKSTRQLEPAHICTQVAALQRDRLLTQSQHSTQVDYYLHAGSGPVISIFSLQREKSRVFTPAAISPRRQIHIQHQTSF